MNALTTLLTEYSKSIANNPLMALYGVYLTGIVTYLLRSTPTAIWSFITRNSTTTLELTNAGSIYGGEEQFNAFMAWFMQSKYAKHSRTLYVGSKNIGWSENIAKVYGPGKGRHYFFFNRRFFWFTKETLPSEGSEKEKLQIIIKTFGRSHQPLEDLITKFEYKPAPDTIGIYVFSKSDNRWVRRCDVVKRPIDSVFIDEVLMNEIIDRLDWFTNNKQWYLDKHIAYKLIMLFFGPYGTGKTTLARVLAARQNRSLYILDLSVHSNESLAMATAVLPKNACILIEDVDASTQTVHQRQLDSTAMVSASPHFNEETGDYSGLTLAGVLNVLDGVIPLDDVIVFMSTNHPEKLDKALTRKARIDHMFEIGLMTHREIVRFTKHMYPGYTEDEVVFGDAPGCDIQAAFTESPFDVEAYINKLKHTRYPDITKQLVTPSFTETRVRLRAVKGIVE